MQGNKPDMENFADHIQQNSFSYYEHLVTLCYKHEKKR